MEKYRALVAGQTRGFWPECQRAGLWLASVPYGLAMRVRNRLYQSGWKKSFRAPVPVVSVGNLTLGGTGKTPCVEYVARLYRQHELRVAILSRGYGSSGGRNDEALVLEDNLPDVPHLQGADRVALAMTAVEELESEVLLLDDGFQHRRLQRDLDIVLVDATNPWGHDHLFPRGLLREPPTSLRRAGVVMLTRCDQVTATSRDRLRQAIARHAPQAPLVETRHRATDLANSEQETAGLEQLRRQPIAAFCGIGNPEAFRATLLGFEAEISDFRVFPDHHAYTRADVEELRLWAGRQTRACLIVTTQKDLVKLRLQQLGGRPLWAVRICLQVEQGKAELERKVLEVVPVH
ncbi:MAG: tetraacyldisaccharide 4'-kinase [Planctomycetota bacterium]|nr:MAG: tetraacyldisaccharide 4'-kinase [Planctomycetota bacterium]